MDQPPQTEQRKRKHRRGGRRRRRRQSFLAPDEAGRAPSSAAAETPSSFYRLGQASGDRSTTSLDSQALLDHRDQPMMRPRRDSRPFDRHDRHRQKRHDQRDEEHEDEDDDEEEEVNDRTPLIRSSSGPSSPQLARYSGVDFRTSSSFHSHHHHSRRPSGDTTSTRRSPRDRGGDYDVNNPPSIPGSPKSGPDMGYDDAVITGADFDFGPPPPRSPEGARRESTVRDAVIQIDGDELEQQQQQQQQQQPRKTSRAADSEPPSPLQAEAGDVPELTPGRHRRRRTLTTTTPAEEDVCFPADLVAEEDGFGPRAERRRRRRREWPDLAVLEEWSREEKEERSGEFRVKKISEPVLVGGRLRPQYAGWRRQEDEAPYRFTYFNEEFQSTIHAQSISELVQPGGSFRELFIPDPPELEDSEESDAQEEDGLAAGVATGEVSLAGNIRHHDPSIHRQDSNSGGSSSRKGSRNMSRSDSRFSSETSPSKRPVQQQKPKRYGPRPTWWLDVLSPTDAEMRVITKAFGIHALTAEDIMMQEAREKVELFRHYYFLNYRTFEQDSHSENYLQPVNMYVVVFRAGVLTFHFSQTPHPANVRRRIRQLRDYLILSPDWISYALIDDITDVFGPLIQSIEDEVDDIDDTIMKMHTTEKEKSRDIPLAPGDMLRRVGECRKKVMGMYRLLSNKADVIKGFAKRCNEQWEVAPKSEIGLYLGDIQDHIMTMTSNLTHYETLLSRAHSNYLAQINILMNERQEQTADVLGKLTVLGTIVLPMNIICGMWGMNVKVPGQDVDNLWWFWSITAGLFIFAFVSFWIAKRVYRIV